MQVQMKKLDGRRAIQEPLVPLDLDQCADIDQILDAMARTAFGGRSLGEAWRVLKAGMDDADCRLLVTGSGPASVAQVRRGLCRSITQAPAHARVSTAGLTPHT